jgi:hypothetical protein
MKQDNKEKLDQEEQKLAVSLKTLSQLLDAHRTSIRRWLTKAGIRPLVMGRGKNGAIRYRWKDVHDWLNSRDYAE